MDTPVPATTTEDDRRAARKRWEAARIAPGRADVAAGRVISGEALDRWLEQSMATDEPVPFPSRDAG